VNLLQVGPSVGVVLEAPAAYFTTVRFLAAVHVQVSLEILLAVEPFGAVGTPKPLFRGVQMLNPEVPV